MKKLLFASLLISTTALCQTALKIEEVDKSATVMNNYAIVIKGMTIINGNDTLAVIDKSRRKTIHLLDYYNNGEFNYKAINKKLVEAYEDHLLGKSTYFELTPEMMNKFLIHKTISSQLFSVPKKQS